MGRRLGDVARLVRSKNAGPFWLTFDIMFESDELYRAVRDSEVLGRAAVLALYPQNPALVKVFNCDAALAIKVSFPRRHSSGSPLDSDLFGGSQYAPLLDLIVETVLSSGGGMR